MQLVTKLHEYQPLSRDNAGDRVSLIYLHAHPEYRVNVPPELVR